MVRFSWGVKFRIMFAAARSALGMVPRRALESGVAFPVLETFVEAGGGNSTTQNFTAPAGIAEDDVLLAHMGIDSNGAGTFTPPSDTTPWIEIDQGTVPNNQHASGLWYKVVTAVSEPASYLWTYTQSQLWGGCIMRISGCDTAAPITNGGNGVNVQRRDGKVPSDSDTEAAFEPILCTRTNCLLIHNFSCDNNLTLGSVVASALNGEVNLFVNVHGGNAGTWHGNSHEEFQNGGGTGRRIWFMNDSFAELEERATILIGMQPPIGIPAKLELEGSADNVLFEDSSGLLLLE